jgi:hypothetical protein
VGRNVSDSWVNSSHNSTVTALIAIDLRESRVDDVAGYCQVVQLA